jgi:hypothetical protein
MPSLEVFEGLYFYELIYFNNHGVIGPFTSCKLHKDFARNYHVIENMLEKTETFKKLGWFEFYKDLLELFALASNIGFVQFR